MLQCDYGFYDGVQVYDTDPSNTPPHIDLSNFHAMMETTASSVAIESKDDGVGKDDG